MSDAAIVVLTFVGGVLLWLAWEVNRMRTEVAKVTESDIGRAVFSGGGR